MKLSEPDRAAIQRRLAGNRLLEGLQLDEPAAVVSALCGVQAQDLPAARLAVRARSTGLTDASVERARVEDRSVVRTWAMRGTLHLVAAEDLVWLRELLAPGLIKASARRSEQLALDEHTYSQASTLLQKELSGGALPRPELKRIFENGGIDASGQRLFYLLYRAALEGLVCEGAQVGGQPSYVLVKEWLPDAHDRSGDLELLLHRYLAAYGPAGPDDLAAWSGLRITDCREVFAGARQDLEEMPVLGRPAWDLRHRSAPGDWHPTVRLLPAFDTFLLGFKDRGLHLDAPYARRVNAGGGIVKPVLQVDGRVKGVWRLLRRGGRAEVQIAPFERLANAAQELLVAEVQDIGRFLDAEVSFAVGKPEPPAEIIPR
ncbi:MAG TPA: winged helix DNA-binding domain-containing protein [Actinomycetota bacterium]|nr:winged helix DNA-binding domain-containing protein [Actinomycetota bacterium]